VDDENRHTDEVLDTVPDGFTNVYNSLRALQKFTHIQNFGAHDSHNLVMALHEQIQ
jgi:hypothetical protein